MGKPITRPGTKKLYFSYKDPATQKWVNRVAGEYVIGQEAEAQKYIDSFLKQLAEGKPTEGPITVKGFIEAWCAGRDKANKPSAKDDRTRLTKHVVPRIGELHMLAVKPTTIDDLITDLRSQTTLAPTTIRQVAGLVSQVFKRATKAGVISANPVQWERGTLPAAMDKDPTWRQEAIFTREEGSILISHPALLWDRRVLTALKLLAALRHSEAANLTWAQYDATTQPLGAINLGKTKSGVPRMVPVHPTLAKVLTAWRLTGWQQTYGREPTSDDYIVPTRNMTEEHPRGTAQQPTESQKAFISDLKLLGLRVKAGTNRQRRGHDLRRTMITLALADGAAPNYLRKVTHGGSKADMMDVYSSPDWAMRCSEVAKLKLDLVDPQLLQASCKATPAKPNVVGKRWMKMATPTGFEPVLPA